MSRKHCTFRVYFREEPTSYYSLSAVSVKAAIRQAKATCRGLRACGHDFSGGPENVHSVHGELHKHKKRHCRTCFVKKTDFKAPWLPACL